MQLSYYCVSVLVTLGSAFQLPPMNSELMNVREWQTASLQSGSYGSLHQHQHLSSEMQMSSSTTASSSHTTSTSTTPKASYDVCIIGSGIGGLCAGAMLSHYGYSVAIFESHSVPGGAAHGFTLRDRDSKSEYIFDTGPSFFSGLNPSIPAKASNPLRTVLDAIGESVHCVPYTTFGLKMPEGDFVHSVNFGKEGGVLDSVCGKKGMDQWTQLMEAMKPLEEAVAALPTAAIRADIGAALTVGPYLPNFGPIALRNPLALTKLTQPFQTILNEVGIAGDSSNTTTAFVQNWLDLLCFCLSGLPANGTITAEMGLMLGEFYAPDATMDCPVGGAKAIVDALVRGIEKKGGSIFCNAHVQQIVMEDGKAVGIQLKKNKTIVQANKSVISNLSVWDLYGSGILSPTDIQTHLNPSFVSDKLQTPECKSFLHLHVGFEMTREELDNLQAHYMYLQDWDRGVQAEDNAALISIPSVHDDTLAPEGQAVLHIYTPATESYDRWANLRRNSDEYKQLKEERAEYLWTVLETVIPDIRRRTKIHQIGTPLTHERFLRRHRGSYGPAIVAGTASFPFPQTPIPRLLTCGDSNFPGIGVPAVAGSGLLACHAVDLNSVKPQLALLEQLNRL